MMQYSNEHGGIIEIETKDKDIDAAQVGNHQALVGFLRKGVEQVGFPFLPSFLMCNLYICIQAHAALRQDKILNSPIHWEMCDEIGENLVRKFKYVQQLLNPFIPH